VVCTLCIFTLPKEGFDPRQINVMVIARTMQNNHNAIQGEEGAHGICLSSFAIDFLHSASFLQLQCSVEWKEEGGRGGDKIIIPFDRSTLFKRCRIGRVVGLSYSEKAVVIKREVRRICNDAVLRHHCQRCHCHHHFCTVTAIHLPSS
jgi:hypothetical protein